MEWNTNQQRVTSSRTPLANVRRYFRQRHRPESLLLHVRTVFVWGRVLQRNLSRF